MKRIKRAADFDLEFFRRFYLDPKTAAVSREEMTARAQFIAAFADYLGLGVRRILDAGCGLGLMRPTFRRIFPEARYHGLEISADMCAKYGWTQGSVDTWRSARPFDIVICYDVVQYLPEGRAAAALANLARHCRGLLYFSALTREDWLHNCDRTRTDRDVHMRPAAWYRQRLRRRFHEAGAGLWVRKGAPVTLWSLEYAP